MANLDARFRDKIDNLLAHALDRHYSVVQKENLPLPLELALDGVANDPLVVTTDHGFDGQTIERRCFNGRHVLYADEREIKRARDRRGGKREKIDQFE